MKIYFNASLVGKEKYFKEFKMIIKIVNKLHHEIYSDHVMKRNYQEVNKQDKKQHEANFQKTKSMIKKSDVMIVESTYPSIGVGHTMTLALEMYKPVLVLYQTIPHTLLIGDPNRLLTVKKYSPKNINKVEEIIKTFLKRAGARLLKKKFNFMLSQEQENYLDWASQKQSLSKANFIRQLIDQSRQKNKDHT